MRALRLGCRVLFAVALTAGFAGAPRAAKDNPKERLKTIEGQIKQSETERARLEQQATTVEKQTLALQKHLVAAATKVQAQEKKIADAEARLDSLKQQEGTATEALKAGSAHMAELLAAMERLSQQPTAALILRPVSISNTARTAILLDYMRNYLTHEAEGLRKRLRAVQALGASIGTEEQALRDGLDELSKRQGAVAALLKDRKAQQASLSHKIEEQQARQQALAQEADSLEALLRKLDEQAKKEPYRGTGQPLDSIPFSSARGSLPLPAAGRIVRSYGQKDAAGHPSSGIYLQTLPGAEVTAPWDGRVVFAGPFRDYGLLLIIDNGEGYHTLLAGMGVIDVVVSQWVLAGEPIGQMAKKVDGEADNAEPRLYIELRQEGRSINPMPWLAETDRKVRG